MASDKEKALLAEHFTESAPARIHVITMSDRASRGEYEDRSGPKLVECVEAFLKDTGIVAEVDRVVLSDDANGLKEEIYRAKAKETDVLFTTGGTGVGPRDNTPDVVLPMMDKVIPGVMELVRMKYGVDKPCAVLSRTLCATMGEMLVFVLPGSTKGVDEYMGEIVEVLPHLLCVVHQLDVH